MGICPRRLPTRSPWRPSSPSPFSWPSPLLTPAQTAAHWSPLWEPTWCPSTASPSRTRSWWAVSAHKPNVAECEEQLPNFWESIAVVLWPAYYSPEADWMCAGICKAPEDHAMTCEECQTGIMKSQEQLLNPKTIDYLVEQLTPIICASNEDE